MRQDEQSVTKIVRSQCVLRVSTRCHFTSNGPSTDGQHEAIGAGRFGRATEISGQDAPCGEVPSSSKFRRGRRTPSVQAVVGPRFFAEQVQHTRNRPLPWFTKCNRPAGQPRDVQRRVNARRLVAKIVLTQRPPPDETSHMQAGRD